MFRQRRGNVNAHLSHPPIPQRTVDDTGIKLIWRKLDDFWFLCGLVGDSQGLLKEKKAARDVSRDDNGKTWIQVWDYRDSDEGLAKDSGRQAGRSYFAIKFGGNEFGPKDLGFAPARRWFDIQCKESMKEVVSEEGYQQEALHGAGIMLVDVIGVPFVDQFVKGIILDIPSLVSQMDGSANGNLGSR